MYGVAARDGLASPLVTLRILFLSQGLLATVAYRLTHYARFRGRSRLLATIAHIFYRVVMVSTGIGIDHHAHIGPGLKFPHRGRIVIGGIRMGANCDIYHGVTLGGYVSTLDTSSPGRDVPTLGDRVWVGPGAVVAGGVTIEDDVVVGANSLLVRDAPARAVMIGVPARLVSRRGSFTLVTYRGMESDDERKLALADLENGPEGTS